MEFSSIIKKKKYKEELITLGKVKGSLYKEETLSEAQLNHHVHVVGASGYGKSVLLEHIVKDRIIKGKGMLFIDLKGDIETIERFKTYAKSVNRQSDVQMFSISNQQISNTYNLILDGTATQLRDKIMLSLVWSEEYYKNQSSSFLLKLLIGLCYLRDNQNIKFNLGTILYCIQKLDFLQTLIEKIPDSESKVKFIFEECYLFLRSSDQVKSLQGLKTQLESLIYADFGDLISRQDSELDLFESVQNQKLVFIFLDSRRYGETAKTVGKFILQDLKMVSSRVDSEVLKVNRKQFTVIIDEFADLASEDFIGFLDRARSAKFGIVVAHQEICDLLRISPEFAGRLMGNTSTLYAFLQKRPESADLIGSIAGTRTTWKQTMRTQKILFFDIQTGDKSLREVEEFNIHPNIVKSLKVGECVSVKKYPEAVSQKVQVKFEM